MYQIAIVWWLVKAAGGSAGKWIGLFMVCGALPSILFAKQIGGIVDRLSAKKLLVVSSLLGGATAGVFAILLFSSKIALFHILILGFVISLFQAVMDPTFNKALQEVVPPEDIESGVALQTATQPISNFGGAMFGAALVDYLGVWGVVGLSAFLYLVCSICNKNILFKRGVGAQETHSPNTVPLNIFQQMPILRDLLLCFGVINFFLTPTLVILPLYTKKILNESALFLGFLEGSLWIGLLAGSFLSRLVNFTGNIIKIGVLCVITAGVSLFLPGVVIEKSLYLAALFVVGITIGVNNVKFIALFQAVLEPSVKGRFFAIMQAMISFTFPISYFLFGFLGDYFSPTLLCIIQGIGITATGAFLFSLSAKAGELFGKAAILPGDGALAES